MHFPSLSASFLLFSALLATASADTLVLTDGTEHQGVLESENAEQVRFRVQVTPTISRLQTFDREEVRRIDVTTEDQKQLGGILGLIPAPELLDALGYDQRIDQAETFLAEFPEAENREKVQEVLTQLREERRRVGKGERFLDGRWLNRVQLENRQPELDSIRIFNRLQQSLERRQWAGVMAAWDELDQFHRGTRGFAEARALALGDDQRESFLQQYAGVLTEQLGRVQQEQQRNPQEISREVTQQFDQTRNEEKRAGRKWLTINEKDPKHLDETLKQVAREQERLGQEDTAKLQTLRQAMEAVYTAFDQAQVDGVEQGIRAIGSNGASRGVVAQLQERLEEIEERGPEAAAVTPPEGAAAAENAAEGAAAGAAAEENAENAVDEAATGATQAEEAAAAVDGAATESSAMQTDAAAAGADADGENAADAAATAEDESTADQDAATDPSRPDDATGASLAADAPVAMAPPRAGLPLVPIIGSAVGLLVVLLAVLLVLQKRQAKRATEDISAG